MNTYRIIIPVHNPEPKFIEFLSRLEELNPSSLDKLIIVDDGSTNQTISNIKQKYPSVNILRGDGNLWWGGGIRVGMEYALREHIKVAVWLNSDCLPDNGAIEKLVNIALNPNVGAVGAWCYTRGAEKWGFNPGFKNLKPILIRELEEKEFVSVHGLNGNFVAVNMEVVNLVGLPRADLFPHYMDGPYTYQIYKMGYKLQIASEIRASLERDLERSVSVTDYCSVWQVNYQKKLKYFFLSRRSPHHLRDKFFRVKSMRSTALAFPVYMLSELNVIINVTVGHLYCVFIPVDKLIEKILLKYEKISPIQLLRKALVRLSQRQ